MKVTVKLKGEKAIMRALEHLSKEKKRMVISEVYASGVDVQQAAKDKLKANRSWDLGFLANSIIVDLSIDKMIAEVGPTAAYGIYVEHGAKPHFPPLDALEGWARRHGFDSAWPICKAISKRGLPAKPFLFPAWLKKKEAFWKKIKEILAR
jgi:hypothetical protein